MQPYKYCLFLLYTTFFLTACSTEQKQESKPKTPPLQVSTITLKNEPIPIWKQYTGITKASSDQEVRLSSTTITISRPLLFLIMQWEDKNLYLLRSANAPL